jgi:hypothetical protein
LTARELGRRRIIAALAVLAGGAALVLLVRDRSIAGIPTAALALIAALEVIPMPPEAAA